MLFGVRKLGYKLHELFDITWGQFEFESYAWGLENEEKTIKWQYTNFRIMWAPHVDPKSLPKSFDQYRGIKPKVSEQLQSAFAAEMAKFNELQKKGNPAN